MHSSGNTPGREDTAFPKYIDPSGKTGAVWHRPNAELSRCPVFYSRSTGGHVRLW